MSFSFPGDYYIEKSYSHNVGNDKSIFAEAAAMSSDAKASYGGASSSARIFSAGGGGYSSGGREVTFDGTFKPFSSSFFGDNDKPTMQNLNHRLANYLDKVRALEESNTQLERKIHEWYEKQGFRAHFTQWDNSNYCTTIDELRAKIFNCTTDNYNVILELDNARLAAEDFKRKYENELSFHRSMEPDIIGLRRVLDQLTISRSDLEIQTESLNEELAYLKQSHNEEMGEMSTKMTGQIHVEMDAAPGIDLTIILAEMRRKYEIMGDKNRREAEAKFIATSEKLPKGVMANVDQMQSGKSEIIELRHSLQGLEIEVKAQLSLKTSLEISLSKSECSYGAQLLEIQSTISGLEAQLTELRSDMGRQNHEYKVLLDVKNRLQMEIDMYKKLLDSQDANSIATRTSKSVTYARIMPTKEDTGEVISCQEIQY